MVLPDLTLNKIYNKNTELYQNRNGYRFNSDSMILSWFVNRTCSGLCSENSALEIGAGSGIVSIVLKRRGFLPKIDCVEIQKSLCEILEKNIERNSLTGEIAAFCADFNDFAKTKRKKYDLVFVNPPYFAKESGHLSIDSEKALAKHEVAGSLADFERFAALGAYFGCGGMVTFKKADNIRALAVRYPEDRLLLETDSPYLAPVPFRGRENHPEYLPWTAHALAALRGWSMKRTVDLTTSNAKRFFRIPPRR